jgi:Protein of unknown function (DUF2568)
MPDRPSAQPVERDPASVGIVEVFVFLAELVLLAVLAVAGARIGDGALAAVSLGVALPLIAAVLWGLLLAPRATRRLPYPARLVVKLALVAAASTLLAVSGAVVWSVAFLVMASALFSLGEAREHSEAF